MLKSQCHSNREGGMVKLRMRMSQFLDRKGTQTGSMVKPQQTWAKPLFITHIQGITAKIQCVCGARSKLREALGKVKEPTPELKKKKSCLYLASCMYVTTCTFGKQEGLSRSCHEDECLKEWDTGHKVKWEFAAVNEFKTNLTSKMIMEAGCHTPQTWMWP